MSLGGLIALLWLLGTPVWPDEPATPAAAAPATTEAPATSTPAAAPDTEAGGGDGEDAPPVVKQTRKVRRGGREKEAEGTQAPNRFQADTVIKSQYKLDGQLLEVDPD